MKSHPIARLRLVTLALASLTSLLSAGTANAFAIVTGFKGTTQLEACALGQCFRPPDTMGAVGTTQFLETNNGANTVYDKNTGAILSRKSMTQFWADIGQPGGANGDQRVLFDHYTNRWMAIGFGTSGNSINFGVSDTSNAMGTWKTMNVTGASIGVPLTTLDYPTLAMDDKGVYVGTNNFPNAGGFSGTSLIVIPKTSLFGGVLSMAGSTVFTTPYPAGPNNGFAIQAAVNWQGNPGNTVAVVADSCDTNDQVFYKVNGVNASFATQTPSVITAGTAYANSAGKGRQPDGSRVVDTLSPRITANAVQYNGRVYSTSTIQGAGDFAVIRWNAVDANTGLLVAQGELSGGNYDRYEGSIAINEFGQAVIGFNRSGFAHGDGNGDGLDDGNISFMARTYQVDSSGALVDLGSELLLKASLVSDYHCGIRTNPAACRERWGDYAAVTFDPLDHSRFFAIGEYAEDWAILPGFTTTPRAIWATYIASITLVPELVPEPGSFALLALSLVALSLTRRTRVH